MKPKVLFILHLHPPIHGAALVGKSMKDSTLISKLFDSKFINLATSFTLDEIGKGGAAKLPIVWEVLNKVFWALWKTRYDLCYITISARGFGFYKDVLIVSIVKSFGVKIVYHFHNKGIEGNSKTRFNRWLYRFVFRKTKSILLSPKLYPELKNFVKKEDIYFCPNGIVDQFSSIPQEAFSKSENAPCRFLFLSHMMQEKGVKVLLEACTLLKAQGFVFECRFVGGWAGITEDFFNSEVKRNKLDGFVVAVGPKYEKEKAVFFLEADVFVFPTLNEVFGLVNLEAMQYSLPIIASDEGGISDILVEGETGFLVKKGDVAILANRMEKLLRNPELRIKMGTEGRKRYEKLFTLQVFENRISDILSNIASKD